MTFQLLSFVDTVNEQQNYYNLMVLFFFIIIKRNKTEKIISIYAGVQLFLVLHPSVNLKIIKIISRPLTYYKYAEKSTYITYIHWKKKCYSHHNPHICIIKLPYIIWSHLRDGNQIALTYLTHSPRKKSMSIKRSRKNCCTNIQKKCCEIF